MRTRDDLQPEETQPQQSEMQVGEGDIDRVIITVKAGQTTPLLVTAGGPGPAPATW